MCTYTSFRQSADDCSSATTASFVAPCRPCPVRRAKEKLAHHDRHSVPLAVLGMIESGVTLGGKQRTCVLPECRRRGSALVACPLLDSRDEIFCIAESAIV